MMKRITAIIMLVVMLITMIPFASAAETTKSEVEQELAEMLFDGKAWDPQAFLKKQDVKDGIYLIAVDERGFQYGGGSADYGFYLYIYNPTRRTLIWNSNKNMVQMAVAWEEDRAINFEKFNLQLVSKSSNGEYLKYKVVDHYSQGDVINMQTRMALYQNSKSKRLYEISSIEFLTKGDTNATDYAYGCKVEVTGYEAGRGQSGKNADTKKLTYKASRSLELDVHQVYWRTQTSGKDVGYRNQINGAYFAVSNDVWDNYENLYSIKCTWDEYRTKPMIVTDDEALYNALKPYIGKKITPYDSEVKYSIYGDCVKWERPGPILGSVVFHTECNFGYNVKELESSYTSSQEVEVKNPINPLMWLLPPASEIKLNAEVASADDVLKYYHENMYDLPLFTGEVDEGRTAGRNYVTVNLEGTDANGNPMFPLDNYDSTHKWWQKIFDYTLFNGGVSFDSVDTGEDYSDTFEAITVFRKGDSNTTKLLSGSLEQVAKNCFLQTEEMAKEFKAFVNLAHANDETVVLFRYAETDFYSETAEVTPAIDGHVVISWQTAFLDFDVIQLDFHDEKQNLIVVPASNDPEDVFGGVQAPNTSTDGDLVGTQLKDQAKEILDAFNNSLKQLGYWAGIIMLAVLAVILILVTINFIPTLTRWIERMGSGERQQNGNKRRSKSRSTKPKGSRSKKK